MDSLFEETMKLQGERSLYVGSTMSAFSSLAAEIAKSIPDSEIDTEDEELTKLNDGETVTKRSFVDNRGLHLYLGSKILGLSKEQAEELYDGMSAVRQGMQRILIPSAGSSAHNSELSEDPRLAGFVNLLRSCFGDGLQNEEDDKARNEQMAGLKRYIDSFSEGVTAESLRAKVIVIDKPMQSQSMSEKSDSGSIRIVKSRFPDFLLSFKKLQDIISTMQGKSRRSMHATDEEKKGLLSENV